MIASLTMLKCMNGTRCTRCLYKPSLSPVNIITTTRAMMRAKLMATKIKMNVVNLLYALQYITLTLFCNTPYSCIISKALTMRLTFMIVLHVRSMNFCNRKSID